MSGISSAAVSLFIAILSGLGVGSGGLFVIWLTMVEGVDAVSARGLNLLFFVFSATSALLFHLIRKRIRIQAVVTLSVFGALGTVAGSIIGDLVDPFILRKIFGAMLFLSGSSSLLKSTRKRSGTPQ